MIALKRAGLPLACLALVLGMSDARSEPRYDVGSDCPLGSVVALDPADRSGIVVGGKSGEAIALDIPCPERAVALRAFLRGLEGPLGRVVVWSNAKHSRSGNFRVSWEFDSAGKICRDFTFDTYARGRHTTRLGTACREDDGNWHLH